MEIRPKTIAAHCSVKKKTEREAWQRKACCEFISQNEPHLAPIPTLTLYSTTPTSSPNTHFTLSILLPIGVGALRKEYMYRHLLGLVPLNLIVWCYVWHYVWHYVWINVLINKVVILLSKMMVTWIFGHYHIAHEMRSMWFLWFSNKRYIQITNAL